ncbi:hypothetical protein KI387_008380 [Taxus chinensis]|uniref:Uncharacterized protein n=1 Tax=Taxus chinensis TaxID=29808 RepID=A0AA38CQC1_TAXCH|nr:hypothetical protein KI387_008380 [Taxus chinensis]
MTTAKWMWKKVKQECSLVNFDALPEYMKDNEYILKYYRSEWPLKQILWSIFSWHNETLNIWTHLVGFLLFLALTISSGMELTGIAEFSSLFPRSLQKELQPVNASDHYVLCTPIWQVVYLTGITTMAAFTVLILLTPAFSTARFRSFRAMLFLAMGFSGVVPAIHAVTTNWNEPHCFVTLAYELAMAFFYAVGTFFYVSRIPERWKPGLFDIAGHSHQIFHLFVVAGAFAHYCAALIFLEWRDRKGCDMLG